jgi:hypothetical protein
LLRAPGPKAARGVWHVHQENGNHLVILICTFLPFLEKRQKSKITYFFYLILGLFQKVETFFSQVNYFEEVSRIFAKKFEESATPMW